jgi:hypothetical protein
MLENNIQMEDRTSSVVFYGPKGNVIFSSISYRIFSEELSQDGMRLITRKEKYKKNFDGDN